MYKSKRRRRVRIRLSRRCRLIATVLAAFCALLLLLGEGKFDTEEQLSGECKKLFTNTVNEQVSYILLSDEADTVLDTEDLPTAAELSRCKADVLAAITEQLGSYKLFFLPKWQVLGVDIKIPKLVSISAKVDGSYKLGYCSTGINMGVCTMTLVIEAEMRANELNQSLTTECIVFQGLLEGDVPDSYYADICE